MAAGPGFRTMRFAVFGSGVIAVMSRLILLIIKILAFSVPGGFWQRANSQTWERCIKIAGHIEAFVLVQRGV